MKRDEGAMPVIRPVRADYADACAIQDRGTVVLVRNVVDPASTWHNPEALRDACRSVIRLSRACGIR